MKRRLHVAADYARTLIVVALILRGLATRTARSDAAPLVWYDREHHVSRFVD